MDRTAFTRPVLRLAAAAACALAAGALATPAPYWVPAGASGELMQYFIDAETVHRQRDITYYRVFGRGVRDVSRETSMQAEVGVDCARRMRVEYVSTVRWRGGVRTTTGTQLQPVAEGSRQAEELATACKLAQQDGGTRLAGAGPAEVALSASVEPARGASGGLRWSGTGFAVTRGVVVTNDHVVRGCGRIRVGQGDAAYDARVLAVDSQNDLAALSVAEDALVPLPLAQDLRELGEPIAVLGYPLANVLGSDLRVTTGIVSALSGVGGDPRLMQISAPVQPGNSGGPVLNEYGQVSAVVVTKMDLRMNTENVSFAVRLPALRKFLADHQIAAAPVRGDKRTPLTVAQAVKRAAPSVLLVQCS